jgi:DNA sulfur modification protein DndD
LKYQKITINNFRQFYGKNEISFPSKKGVFLIHANNGVGKSALYHAFRYVLYGESVDQILRKPIKIVDFLSYAAADEEKYSFNVKLEFEHDGIEYELFRGHKSNLSKGQPTEDNHFESSLTLVKDGDVIKEKDIKIEIDNLIRKEIAEFFLVDSEYITDLFANIKEAKGPLIKQAIDKTIGVGILDDGKNDLQTIHESYGAVLNKQAQQSKAQQKLSEEYVQKDLLYKKSTESLKKLQKDLQSAEKKVEKLQTKRDSYKVIEENVNQRKALEGELRELTNQKNVNYEKLQRLIIDEWNAPVAEKADKVLSVQTKLLNQKNKRDNEISNLEKAIKDKEASLKNSKCHTCKQDLPEKITKLQETELKKLEERLEIIKNKEVSGKISPHPYEISKYSKVSSKLFSELETQYYQISQEIGKIKNRLKKLDDLLKDGDYAEIRSTVEKLEEALSFEREISIAYKESNTLNEFNRKQLESATRKLSKTFSEDDTLTKIVKITDNLRGLLEKSHEKFSIDAKELVEKFAATAFDSLKNDNKYTIALDEDYVVYFKTNTGRDAGSASMGYSRIIAVSLIAGLNGASVTDAPLLIDSPMAGLDDIHKENVYNFLTQLGDQIMLSVPPGEWVEEKHRKLIKNEIVGEITLERIDEFQTRIHDGFQNKYLER